MKITGPLLAILFLVFISCKENKTTTTSPKPESGTSSNVPSKDRLPGTTPLPDKTATDSALTNKKPSDAVMKFIVSFYSIGSGIDRGAPDKLKSVVESFGKNSGKNVEYTETPWGREGERDFCFPLTGYSDEQVADFIKQAKESLKSAPHVHFFENQQCRKGR